MLLICSCCATLLGKMIKGRPRGSSVSTGIERAEAPRFVRVKKRTTVEEKASDKESGSNDKVADRRTNVVFVRKSAATLLGEAGGHGVKALSPASSSMTGAHTTPGGKRHLAAALQREEGDLLGKTAKRTKVEGDTPVSNSRRGKRKRRRRGQKVVVALAKKDYLEEALSYLKAWHSQRETWSFRKKMQVCLLEHMYDSSRVRQTHMHTHTLPCLAAFVAVFRLPSHTLQLF